MILSDRELCRLYPDSRAIGPASIDLHLGDGILGLRSGTVLDPEIDQSGEWQPLEQCTDGRYLLDRLHPYLGVTAERLTILPSHVGLLHGVSSIGRLFLLIHVTAGLVDPGWKRGRLTLELFPLGAPIRVRPGMRIGQITLHELTSECQRPYGGRYVDDQMATPSRSHLDGRAS